MQADRWPRCSVLEQMDVLAVEESYGLVGVLLGERLDSGGSTAVDGGSPFGQNAVDDDECATVAAVIMPTGVLTGQPGDQPGVNVAVDVQWDSTSRRRDELHRRTQSDRLAAARRAATTVAGGVAAGRLEGLRRRVPN